jgi:hypothetical protein
MVSNRGNQHDGISTEFLQACYLSGDSNLTKKVAASIKKDLQQQMRYYKALGEENMSDDQLANNAYQLIQGKGGNLSDRQLQFAQDIFTTYRMLLQMAEWEKQYGPPVPGLGRENNPTIISNPNPPAKSDTKPKKAK